MKRMIPSAARLVSVCIVFLIVGLMACGDKSPTNGDHGTAQGNELVEFFLRALDVDGQPLPLNSSGVLELKDSQVFLLEASYQDLRPSPSDIGIYSLHMHLEIDGAEAFEPMLAEVQRIFVGDNVYQAVMDDPDGVFQIGMEGHLSTYSASGADFVADPLAEFVAAFQTFGYTRGVDYELEYEHRDIWDFERKKGGPPSAISLDLFWNRSLYSYVDMPDVILNPDFMTPVHAYQFSREVLEPDGVTPYYHSATRFSIDFVSPSFRDGEQFYSSRLGAGFDPTFGFREVSGFGPSLIGGVREATGDGSFAEPFVAFRIRVRAKSALASGSISLVTTRNHNSVHLYGEEGLLTLDEVLLDGDHRIDLLVLPD